MVSSPASPFRSVRSQSASSNVADQIVRAIKAGAFRVGSQLPPEREMARQFDVSRSTVREALTALVLAGVLDSHQGRGTTVIGTADHVAAWGRDVLPPQVLDARLIIEPELAALAARTRDPGGLEALREALTQLESQGDVAPEEYDDHDFHRAVARAARNPILEYALEYALRYTDQQVWRELKRRALSLPGALEGHLAEARELVAAIESGQERQAAKISREHLVRYRSEMLKGDDGDGRPG